jgi:FkbM family methyltransferase
LRRVPGRLAEFIRNRTGILLSRDGDVESISAYLDKALSERDQRRLTALRLKREALEVRFNRRGVIWTTDIGDVIGHDLYVDGGYETPAIDALLARLGPGTIVDVGANVGTTSVPFALAGREVIAIEPVPSTFELLRRNVADNGLDETVTCVASAIATESGHVEMFVTSSTGQSEVARAKSPTFTRWHFHDYRQITVPSEPLASVLESCGVSARDVALVWADTQGSEAEVIASAEGLWDEGVPLYVELDPFTLDEAGGFDGFLSLVREHFASFVTQDELERDPLSPPRPISELRSVARGLGENMWTNVLLLSAERSSAHSYCRQTRR